MKKKRISRRELKEEIKRNRRKICDLSNRLDDALDNYAELKARFDMLGKEAKEVITTSAGQILTYVAEAKTYGTFATLYDSSHEVIEHTKFTLAERLAEGLIEESLVKFNVSDSYIRSPLDAPHVVVSAKLYVLPWEQVNRSGRRIVVGKKLENLPETDGKEL